MRYVLVAAGILVLVFLLRKHLMNFFLRKTSPTYKEFIISQLEPLQAKLREQLPLPVEYSVALNSKAQFDRFNPKKHLMALMHEDETLELIFLVDAKIYSKVFIEYTQAVTQLNGSWQGKCEHGRVNRIVKKAVNKQLHDASQIRPGHILGVTWSYTSPQGRNHYQDSFGFCFYDETEVTAELNGTRTRKETIKDERSRMTQSLRYDILKRDGFACQICGSTIHDGVKLHVDHILPVSKGGKTEPANLRTLCDQCNLGKKAKYDYTAGAIN